MLRRIDPRLVIRTAVSLLLVGFLLWRVDLDEAARALRDAQYVYVIPGLALFACAKFLVAVRWRVIMSSFADIPVPPLFGILLASNVANSVLPARLGDLVRVQVPAQRYGVSRARMVAAVFATESLLDGVAFAVIGLIGLALIDLQGFPTGVFWGLLGLVAGGLIAVIPLSQVHLSEGWTNRAVIRRFPDRVRLTLEETAPHFIDGLSVFCNLRQGTRAIGLSFSIWMLEVGMFALFGEAFGFTLSMPAWMLIMVAANVISSLPVAPSNIGAYEVALTELCIALGVSGGVAGGFAIAAHMFNIIWIAVAGLTAMWLMRLSPADVFSLGGRQPARQDQAGQQAEADAEPRMRTA